MNSFNYQIWEIDTFAESLKSDLSFKLSIASYIEENDKFINQNFFWNNENVNDDYIKKVLFEIWEKLKKFKTIKNAIKIDENLQSLEKKFLLQVINKSWFELIRFKNSIYLEAEKAWFKLTEEERKKYLKKTNTIQRVLYWSKVSDNLFEIDEIFNKLQSLYIESSEKLTPEDKEMLSGFFKDFGKDLSDKQLQNSIKDKNKNEKKDNEILKNKISIDNVKKIFDLIIELYWLNWWKAKIWNYLNFAVSKNKKLIKIPQSKKNITIKKLLELIDHEIWVHAIRWFNTEKTLKKNYSHYVEAEEWFAKISTSLLYENLGNINIEASHSLISSLISENYNWEKTYDLLKVYYKLISEEWDTIEEIEKEALNRMLRIKKFFSLKEKWAAWKDVSYFRWEKQVLEHLLKEDDIEWFIRKFYFSKLSLKDLEIVDSFKELLEYKENELVYPIWLWKILLNKIIWEKMILKELKEKDLRFKAIDNLSFWVKRKIVEILNFINTNTIKK